MRNMQGAEILNLERRKTGKKHLQINICNFANQLNSELILLCCFGVNFCPLLFSFLIS